MQKPFVDNNRRFKHVHDSPTTHSILSGSAASVGAAASISSRLAVEPCIITTSWRMGPMFGGVRYNSSVTIILLPAWTRQEACNSGRKPAIQAGGSFLLLSQPMHRPAIEPSCAHMHDSSQLPTQRQTLQMRPPKLACMLSRLTLEGAS